MSNETRGEYEARIVRDEDALRVGIENDEIAFDVLHLNGERVEWEKKEY